MSFEPIAIIGQSCVLPGALSPGELWRAVLQGEDLLTRVPEGYWRIDPSLVLTGPHQEARDHTWSDRGGYVRGFEEVFCREGFGLCADEILSLDPLFHWVLHSGREALRSAGLPDRLAGEGGGETGELRAGAVLGNLSYPSSSLSRFAEAVWLDRQGEGFMRGRARELLGIRYPHPQNRFMSGLPAQLLARALDLQAGAFCLDAACSSSLYAVKLACDRLHDRQADLMLAGGVNRADDLFIHIGFCALQAMSRSGQSRPLDRQGDGLVPAEGAAMVLLSRLDDALARGHPILGVIRAVGLSNDGRGRGLLAPCPDGQERALRLAYEQCDLTPEQITLVECHATGTPVGDVVEVQSMGRVFAGHPDLAVGSLKSNLGHLITASGVAGLLKVLAAMADGIRPPTLNVDQPLEALRDTPLRPLQQAEPWTCAGPRRAAVNNFGFGGNNAHLVVEQWEGGPAWSSRSWAVRSPARAAASGSDADSPAAETAVAVVALEALVGTCKGAGELTRTLLSGGSALVQDAGSEPAGRVDPIELPLTGLRFPPLDLEQTLAQQLLVLKAAMLATAQLKSKLSRDRTSVLVGMQCDAEVARYGARLRMPQWARDWARALDLELPEGWVERARQGIASLRHAAGVVGAMPNISANRICSQQDLAGPSFTVSAEELSGIVCLELAVRALRAGEIDAALVGAVDLCCEPVHCEAARAVLGPERQIPGDAAVVLVLKRLQDARRDKDRVLAVLPSAASPSASSPPAARIGLGAGGALCLTPQLGHAHAASGLLHVAAGVLACAHRCSPAGAGQVAAPWWPGPGPRAVEVEVCALGGARATVRLEEERVPGGEGGGAVGLVLEPLPAFHIVCGADRHQVQDRLARGQESRCEDKGPARLVWVSCSSEQDAAQRERARMLLACDHPACGEGWAEAGQEGIFYRDRPLEGEVAFVFTGPAGSYPGMGRELLLALPSLLEGVYDRCRRARETGSWIYEPGRADDGQSPHQKLWGSSFLSQIHTELTRTLLKIQAQATLGFCSGETNALFAMGAWQDLDAFFPEILDAGVFDRNIGGRFDVPRQAWVRSGLIPPDTEEVSWANWRVLASEEELEQAMQGEPLAHLTIISAPGDLVIGGEEQACRRVVKRLGRLRAYPLGYDVAIHCPEMEIYADPWRRLHHRRTRSVPGVRFYSAASCSHYEASADAAADALLGMALRRVDFPALVKRAHQDGVRIFIEHGPRDGCSKWIDRILGEQEHLAVPLDRAGRSSLLQACHAAGQLLAAGVQMDIEPLARSLAAGDTGAAGHPGPAPGGQSGITRAYPSHPEPVLLPPLAARRSGQVAPGSDRGAKDGERDGAQLMAPAPWLVPVTESLMDPAAIASGAPDVRRSPLPLVGEAAGVQSPASPSSSVGPMMPVLARMAEEQARLSAVHQEYMDLQVRLHERFLALKRLALVQLGEVWARFDLPVADFPGHPLESSLAIPGPGPAQPLDLASPPGSSPAPSVVRGGQEPRGRSFSREELEVLASGRISSVFGPHFQEQDGYERQVRLPEPPLLLIDRVTGLHAEPAKMGQGVIWTETEITWDSWFLNDDATMPAGLVVEAGQADLMLISYLGIDLHNQGQRVYRLLGCELTNYKTLPRPGDRLCYEIHVDGHAQAGDVRLFFFHYDCRVGGEVRLSVRNGQAGFFTDEELALSHGVLWDPESGEHRAEARCDPPAVRCTRDRFLAEKVRAFSEGRVLQCFGPGFELAETHSRTPKIQSGRMLLLQEITRFDPRGGPWGRGYLRVQNRIRPDDWYMQGHFKNDPCMPGTLMCEGCLQAMAFYLTAMGYTLERDGWRFDPVPGETYRLQCRGQVVPSSRELTYEVFVEEVHDGPIPTIFADILGTCDGLKIFHGRRMGLRLIPDWPLTSMPHLLQEHVEPRPVARLGDFEFGYASLLACAWGQPSHAFGEMARPFDGTRHIARLPGPPYHFMSRVTRIQGEMGSMRPGASIELEYDIPPDAWYFLENGAPVMPFCVLLEAVLQPCGWLAVFIGCPGSAEVDLCFRNLDGSGTVLCELGPEAGTLRTRTTLRSISKMGDVILVSFEVVCLVGESEKRIYELSTGFGFFPGQALAAQVGLPAGKERRAGRDEPCPKWQEVDLTARPPRYFDGPLRLPGPMLLMLDRVTGYWPAGGRAGLGKLRAEKTVNVSEWFFKAHFFQDPVQPGSLGLEAMIQLLQFHMLHEGLHQGMEHPHFEPIALSRPFTWKYRGQVTPDKKAVVVEMEILERGRGPDAAFAVAEAWLWADDLCIYHSPDLCVRIVPGTAPTESLPPSAAEEVLDPEKDTWLNDHRPNWTLPTLPLMSMVDRMAAAALASRPDTGLRVVGVQDVRLTGWLILDGPRRLRTEVSGPQAGTTGMDSRGGGARVLQLEVTLLVWREAAREALSRFEPVARGTVLLAREHPPAPRPLPPLQGAVEAPDPYAAGALFHGPAFQVLRDLAVGAGGSSAVLDAGGGSVPRGLLNQALLDGSVHGILHDELERWSDQVPPRHIAYPYSLLSASFHGPVPLCGPVRCEVRLQGFEGQARLPIFHVQLIRQKQDRDGRSETETVWADLRLVEVLIPMGPHADDRQKRKDFRDGRFIPGAGLSRFEGDLTCLTDAEVRSRDWLKGSVAQAYRAGGRGQAGGGVQLESQVLDLTLEVAVKDHVAQRARVHPATVQVTVSEQGTRGSCEARPLTLFPVRATRRGQEVTVVDAGPPGLDLDRLLRFGRNVMGLTDWAGEDLSVGLCRAFVRDLVLQDPAAFDQVRGRSVLYLGNHQVQVESMLLPMVVTALGGVHVVTIAKEEHRTGWIGPLSSFSYDYPGVSYPRVIIYFKQQAPASMMGILDELRAELRDEGHSLFVHVQGELGLCCRRPVTRLSSVFIDLAQELSLPIVPVRLAGGLPTEELASPLDFPLGYCGQEIYLGRPIMPEQLEPLAYAERRRRILSALNEDLGPSLEEERPNDPDPELAARVASWQQRLPAIGQVQAVVLAVLQGLPHPSEQTRRILQAAGEQGAVVDDSDEGRWLASAMRWLLGGASAPLRIRYPDGRLVPGGER